MDDDPRFHHFPAELRRAIAARGDTQPSFAKKADITVSLLTKIFRGDPVHRNSVASIIRYLRTDGLSGEAMALRLLSSYLRDVVEGFGFADEELEEGNVYPEILSPRDRAILHAFRDVEPHLRLAFYVLGKAAAKDERIADAVFAFADLASPQSGHRFPEHRFRNAISRNDKKVAEPRAFKLHGGSEGEFLADLVS